RLGVGIEDRPAPQGHDAVLALERGRDGLAFEGAERRLAVLDEDVGDPLACHALDLGVRVDAAQARQLGQRLAHGRLARAWRAHEDVAPRHQLSTDGIAARYAATLRRTSSTESPPNFSSTASASVRATIAWATTAAGATAHTSERWWMAFAGSPVVTSMGASAGGTVEMGFIAARTRRGWPLVMPPSTPPARLVRRVTTPSTRSISSCATEPRRAAVRKPSPISTPLIAWMPMSAAARRA